MSRSLRFPALRPARIPAYILRLPLFTRLCIITILVFWLLELQTVWSVTAWGSLIPKEMGLTTMYRANTYPLVHLGFFHAAVNIVTLTPLLERFEAEYGTLRTLALFAGPFASLPAALYVLVDTVVWRHNTPILGASVWIFLLMGVEAVKIYRTNPYFQIVSYKVPTWITPVVAVMLVSIFIPSASLLGHLSGCAVGYLFGLGFISFLAPPQRLVHWIERKLDLLTHLPHYISVDQKMYGRYGILPTTSTTPKNRLSLATTGRGASPHPSAGRSKEARVDVAKFGEGGGGASDTGRTLGP